MSKEELLRVFYPWKIRVPNEPLDMTRVQPFVGWTEIDKCLVCKGSFCVTYEVFLEWGDTKQYEHIREVCDQCLHTLNCLLIRNKVDRYCCASSPSKCPLLAQRENTK